MQEIQENTSMQPRQRPDGLTFICVLSFIGGGLSFVSNFTIYSVYSELLQTFEEGNFMELPGVDMKMVFNLLKTSGRSYYLFVAIAYVVSIYGVYKIWHLKKMGIHFYAIAQIVLLILPLIFIDSNLSVLPSLIFTAAFIYIYTRYLKIMD